jgi:hypothetical protein
MPKGRTPSPRGGAKPDRLRLVLALLGVAGFLANSCQKDDLLKPGSVESNVLTATYVSSEEFNKNPIEIDGKALQEEWGGPTDPDRPFMYIRLSAEDGSGSPGEVIYASAKAVYTDTDLYFLLQWPDTQADQRKDALHYMGPTVPDTADCFPGLTDPQNWSRDYRNMVWDEDRLYLAFELEPAGDGAGTYADLGCRVACHSTESPQFGSPGYGRLDVWEWLATRTNVTRDLYVPSDNPEFPKYGIPAHLEDCNADAVKGLAPDPGSACWRRNFSDNSDVPFHIYQCVNDPYCAPTDPARCFNSFGEKCRANNGLPNYYIWREDVTATWPAFSDCDVMNEAVLPQGQANHHWRHPEGNPNQDDAVSGYYYTNPDGSRANVRGKAVWSDGFWDLEIARPLDTADPVNDVIFALRGTQGDRQPPADVVFTLAVANNSLTNHWGSAPQILRFGPVSTERTKRAVGGGK